jgi:uncharacterized SAM-binding protein YcdF (DUF218 family)
MKALFRIGFRLARGGLLLFGLLGLLFAAAQFTNLPWRVYKSLSEIADPFPGPPTHILVMGGSGIPGESGLMRTFYAARIAARNPEAEVLVAMPLGAAQSDASRAYLDELLLRGVRAERIHILPDGRNTREQALRLAEYLAGWTHEPPRVLIVTSPEHIRRTAACIRKTCNASLATFPRRRARLAALPAHPLSIEDPLPWKAADLDSSGPAPATRAVVPDIGSSFTLRYHFWANLGYTQDALREYVALLYYRLRGWL